MKQYHKIYIPCNYLESDATVLAGGSSIRRSCREEKDVIVLTIEELREMWAMAKSGPDYPGVFELFLKSKGITI